MFYTIYITTNNTNGKKYIGKHITNNLNDDYLGSGLILTKALTKYGRNNFSKEILHIFDNEEDMNAKEIELITPEIIISEEYYNIAMGGQGGVIVLKPEHPLYNSVCAKMKNIKLLKSKEISDLMKEKHKKKEIGMYGKKQSEHQKDVVRKLMTGKVKSQETIMKYQETRKKTTSDPNYVNPAKGRKATDEQRKNMSIAVRNRPLKLCIYCNRDMTAGNYARYHGDKCKEKKEILLCH